MTTLTQALNTEISGDEATLNLVNGDSFRVKGDFIEVSGGFVSVSLSNNPDKKGRKVVNLSHVVSIEWYHR